MFDEWSPEAEQVTAHTHTYTFNVDRNTVVYSDISDCVSYATTSYFVTNIKDICGEEHTIKTNNLKIELKDGELYLSNDNNEQIHLCGAATTEKKLNELKSLASKLPEETMIDKLVKKQIFELFESGGVQIEMDNRTK